jgi:uncharacterized protein
MTDTHEQGLIAAGASGEMTPNPWLRRIFIGPEGIRAGWCLALYGAMLALIVVAESWWAAAIHLGDLWSTMFFEFSVLVAAVIPAIVMARIEKRNWDAFGLPLREAFSKLFWIGTAWGFLGMTLLLVVLHGFHAFDFGHIVLHGVRVIKFAVFWGVFFLLVGLCEDYLFRGYTQFTLGRSIGFWPAAGVLSLAFGALHLRNAGEAWSGALAAALIGLLFCLTLRRTGTLWFAVGFHAAWDWAESFFYSVPDSGTVSPGHLLSSSFHGPRWLTGGSVGPEGSAMCFAVIAVIWVAFDRVYPAKTEVETGTATA